MLCFPEIERATVRARLTSSDEDTLARPMNYRKRDKKVKSGHVTMAKCTVLKLIEWLHHFVYKVGGECCKYKELSLVQFVLSFCIISEQQKPALRAIMTQHLMELKPHAHRGIQENTTTKSWSVV